MNSRHPTTPGGWLDNRPPFFFPALRRNLTGPGLTGFRSDTLDSLRDSDWTRILGWPGYRAYQNEINEQAKTLKLWVRRKTGNRKLVCSGCGRRVSELHEVYEREVRDLPCFEYRGRVVSGSLSGLRDQGREDRAVAEQAPFSKRFEEIVGQACESAAARQVARRFGLAASTVRALDLHYLERWAAAKTQAGAATDGR